MRSLPPEPIPFTRHRPRAPRHLADMSMAERRAAAVTAGLAAFRADQVSRHYFGRWVGDPVAMSDLGKADRDVVREALLPELMVSATEVTADRGTTVKTAWRLHDGFIIESVLMRYSNRVTLCVSSQAGCGMGCPFCATGQNGMKRNLTTGEIIDQVVRANRLLAASDLPPSLSRVSNIVFMGMGEPMANYPVVVQSVRRLIAPAPEGAGMSARGITVSTVGLVPRMRALATEKLPVTLALSLHAPDDELRNELVPINQRWGVAATLDAAYEYFAATGRRVSIEYALMRDINDQRHRGDLLGKLLAERGRGWVHVNPIPLNPTPGSKWTASDPKVEQAWMDAVAAHGIPVTMRDTRGQDIGGACGQLAGVEQ